MAFPGSTTTGDNSIMVDPTKEKQSLFVLARVTLQNTGGQPLTNIMIDYGDGDKDIIAGDTGGTTTATINSNLYWYENLNNFLVTEWDRLQTTNDTQDKFDDKEQHMIIQDAMNLLLDKLNVDSDDFEDHEQDVDWMKFDDIIGHYLCYV